MPFILYCMHLEGYSSQQRVHVVPSTSTFQLCLEDTFKVKGVPACSLIPLNEDMNSSLGITVLCPEGVPVWEALSTLGLYFNSILLREGAASGNWRCLLFVVLDQNVMCSQYLEGWQMSTPSERMENSEILKIFNSRTGRH